MRYAVCICKDICSTYNSLFLCGKLFTIPVRGNTTRSIITKSSTVVRIVGRTIGLSFLGTDETETAQPNRCRPYHAQMWIDLAHNAHHLHVRGGARVSQPLRSSLAFRPAASAVTLRGGVSVRSSYRPRPLASRSSPHVGHRALSGGARPRSGFRSSSCIRVRRCDVMPPLPASLESDVPDHVVGRIEQSMRLHKVAS